MGSWASWGVEKAGAPQAPRRVPGAGLCAGVQSSSQVFPGTAECAAFPRTALGPFQPEVSCHLLNSKARRGESLFLEPILVPEPRALHSCSGLGGRWDASLPPGCPEPFAPRFLTPLPWRKAGQPESAAAKCQDGHWLQAAPLPLSPTPPTSPCPSLPASLPVRVLHNRSAPHLASRCRALLSRPS